MSEKPIFKQVLQVGVVVRDLDESMKNYGKDKAQFAADVCYEQNTICPADCYGNDGKCELPDG